MTSARLDLLRERISRLRSRFLPDQFDPTGTYIDEGAVSLGCLAFRVMSHAEIEAYLEDRSVELAKYALDAWRNSSVVTLVLAAMVSFSGRQMELPPDVLQTTDKNKVKAWPSKVEIDERFTNVVADYIREVSQNNHGVREKNIVSLLLPLGFRVADFDIAFLASIDDFGKLRGQAAHSSSSDIVQVGIDPKEEFARVELLLAGLQAIDDRFDVLLSDFLPKKKALVKIVNRRKVLSRFQSSGFK